MLGTEITTASSALQITSKQQVITKYDQCIENVRAKENNIFNLIKEYALSTNLKRYVNKFKIIISY